MKETPCVNRRAMGTLASTDEREVHGSRLRAAVTVHILMYSQMGNSRGGAESVFKRVSEGLAKNKHEVTCLYCDYQISPGACRKDDRGWHMAVSVPPTWKSFFRPAYAYRFVRSLIALFWFLRGRDPDVVNQHFFTTTALHFALLKPLFGYRLVLSCHGSDVEQLRAMHRRAAPFILSRTDAVTCVSHSLVDTLQEQVPKLPPTHVIPNGIDYDFWRLGEVSSDARQNKQLISVGSLKRVKGHDVLIQSFPEVLKEHPDATIRLVGDGPKRSEYERMIEDLGLTDCIDITGWLSEVEVRSSLREAVLFVFPSRHEGFGIALLEAMATGCPVVASDVGGISEVVQGADAKLVPPQDSHALAEAINASLRDHTWRETARASSVERAAQFTWDTAVQSYENCLMGARP